MVFIRRKRTSAGVVYQVVRSVRQGATVRQELLCSLARWATVGAALAWERQQVAADERLAALPGATGSPWLASELERHRARVAQLEALHHETGVA
jgi:hypothetical protein